ncbi:energy-coupling factor transporter transmembrane component T family protein [Longispora albida]|uniref:energy-coupling factor transporter transmembrane component T family protein n=1 Tax=Longispora albida TaxID=203523 RepID=UPI00036330FD|nr:energy-coupling factor transporter transmembrane component T [Longispora albida]
MSFAEPLVTRQTALSRRSPVAKLGAATILSLALLSTLDPVAPAVALAGELLVIPYFGVPLGRLMRRCWPLFLAAAGLVLTTALFTAEPTGDHLFWTVTTGSIGSGLSLALRLVAVALPGIAAFATIDPTDLADALIQQLKVPPRFAIGALAALRLLPLLADEWRLLVLARRARGLAARGPVSGARLFAGVAFALLVGAIRRGVRLAVAMDARGFASGTPRTNARKRPFTANDALVLFGAAVLAALALGVSVATGSFHAIL